MTNRLHIVDVHQSFDGTEVLRGVSLTCEPGTVTGLIGPNGCGKTTLLNVVSGFTRSTKGLIYLGKKDLTRLAPYRIAKFVARSFQDGRVVEDLAVLDHLRLAMNDTVVGTRSWSIAEALRSLDLEELNERPCGDLSYGQAKLVGLAAVLVSGAPVWLLDEPATGLSPTIQRALGELLEAARQRGVAVLMADHDLEFLRRYTDSILVMAPGIISRAIASPTTASVADLADLVAR